MAAEIYKIVREHEDVITGLRWGKTYLVKGYVYRTRSGKVMVTEKRHHAIAMNRMWNREHPNNPIALEAQKMRIETEIIKKLVLETKEDYEKFENLLIAAQVQADNDSDESLDYYIDELQHMLEDN